MKNYYSIGELAGYQNISKQTLIFYDTRSVCSSAAYVDPLNGYRYYSPKQIDFLDTILIMKDKNRFFAGRDSGTYEKLQSGEQYHAFAGADGGFG